MKVDFIIIGAQKCGTSSLAFQLAQHPAVSFCARKEPQYFSTNARWRENLHDYHRLFEPGEDQLCGEASTSYTFFPEYPETARRLYEYNPGLKLIYIMRQPVERIVSHYTHDKLAGRVRQPPDVTVLENPIYINRSRYALQLESYLQQFSRQALLLVIFEEYVSDPSSTLQQTAHFLGISTEGFRGIDLSPQNISTRHGHLKRYPGWRLARELVNQAPPAFRRAARQFGRKHLHRLLYRVAEKREEFPDSLKRRLWDSLEADVSGVEGLLGRRLAVFRDGYEAGLPCSANETE